MIKQLLLWIQVLFYYLGSVLFDSLSILEVQFLKALPTIFLVFAIFIKIYRQRKNLFKKIWKCQKKYLIANILTIVNIYFIIVLNNVQEGLLIISIFDSINFFLKTIYHSLLCIPKMTTKLQFGFSVLSLVTYLANNSFDIFIFILFGQEDKVHEVVSVRIKTEIGLAYLASLLAQFTFILDLQTRAIRQKYQQQQDESQQEQQQPQTFQLPPIINESQSIQKQPQNMKIDKILFWISIISFFVVSTFMNLMFIVRTWNISIVFLVFQGFLLATAISSKVLFERKHIRSVFLECQKNFVVSYFLTFINIYLFYHVTIAANFDIGIAVGVGINYFLKMVYYSLLSCSKTISKIELAFSLITLVYYIFNFTHSIVATIYENQPIDSDFFIRVQTQIGIALMTSLTAQYTIIMDVQMDAITQYGQNQNNIQKIIKKDLTEKVKEKKLQIQLIKYEVQQIEKENKKILLDKEINKKIKKYLLDQEQENQDKTQRLSSLQKQKQSKIIRQESIEIDIQKHQQRHSQFSKEQKQNTKQNFYICNFKYICRYFYIHSYESKFDKILFFVTVFAFFNQNVTLNIIQQILPSYNHRWIFYSEEALGFIYVVTKLILMRKKLKTCFIKAQKQFMIPYIFMAIQLYLLLTQIRIQIPTYSTFQSIRTYITVLTYNFYLSFLCIPQTTSRLQFVTAFVALTYALYYYTYSMVKTIIQFQAYQQYYFVRFFIYMTLAVLTISLNLTCVVMDYQIKAIRKHCQIIQNRKKQLKQKQNEQK